MNHILDKTKARDTHRLNAARARRRPWLLFNIFCVTLRFANRGNTRQLEEIRTLVLAKMAEVVTILTVFELQIEVDGLRDELVGLSGDLKKYGYDYFAKNSADAVVKT